MRALPNISTTAKFPGLLPVFVGMEMILTDSVLPPKYARGTACVVVGLEPHPQEPAIEGRASIASDGCVVLRFLPKAVHVKIKGSKDVHLQSMSPTDIDLEGVLAIPPQARPWKFQPSTGNNTVPVTRSQIPLCLKSNARSMEFKARPLSQASLYTGLSQRNFRRSLYGWPHM